MFGTKAFKGIDGRILTLMGLMLMDKLNAIINGLSQYELSWLAFDENEYVRAGVAERIINPFIVYRLRHDKSDVVRRAVARRSMLTLAA